MVTGAAGFIGGRLAGILAAEGLAVRALVRSDRALPHLAGEARIDVTVADLLDESRVLGAVEGVDLVFHCAGLARPWARWETYERDNVRATRALVAACRAARRPPRRVVHVSTVDVYGYPDQPADETAPCDGGAFAYGRSKALGEGELRRLDEARIAWTIVRPTNVFGPRGQFVAEVGDALRSRLMLTIDGGRAHAGLLYVDNLALNLLRAATAAAAAGGIFNLRDDYDLSWRQYLDRLADGIGAPRSRLDMSYRAAWALARVVEAPHAVLGLGSEPLLHRLLVAMFGKTCAHKADRAAATFGARTAVALPVALERSIAWFNDPARRPG